MHFIRKKLRKLHAALPCKIRYPLDVATASIQDTLQNWRIPAYHVQTVLPDSGHEGKMLLFGDRPQYASWIHRFFGRAVEPTLLGQFSLFQIFHGKSLPQPVDIMLLPFNPFTQFMFERQEWRVMPLYINCHVDLCKPIEDLFRSKAVKEDLRVARRLGYHFDFSSDSNKLEEIFHQMFIPTARSRHEERAFLSNLEELKFNLRNGILITALLDEQSVGAILLAHESAETIRLANMGWRNGDDRWRKKGLVAALFNESFAWAREQGYRAVNLGASNPFANDGPLNFKLKWGAKMAVPEFGYANGRLHGIRSFMGVKLNLASPATQRFLSSTPLIEYKKNKLRVVSWNADVPPLFRRQLEMGIEWNNLDEKQI